MKKHYLLTFLILTLATSIYSQENQVDKKGLRKGDWIIMYKGDFIYYDYYDKLLNLEKMLVLESETSSESELRYIEKVAYKKGIKNGEFLIYSGRKNFDGRLPLLAKGNYKDGKIDGDLLMLKYKDGKRICLVKYEQGQPKDQEILIEETLYSAYDPVYETFGTYKVYPIIKIKNGVCIEETVTQLDVSDNKDLYRIVKTDNGFKRFWYGTDGLSGIVKLKTYLGIDELDSNFQKKGSFAIYEKTTIPYDTANLVYRCAYENGKKNGVERYYDSKTKNVLMEHNYENGLMNGMAKLFTSKGQVIAKANYKDGFLNGKYITYYLNDGYNTVYKGENCKTEFNNVSLYSHTIKNEDQEIFNKTIPQLRKDGHTILTDGIFKFYEANYVNGVIQGKYKYFHSNGKILYEATLSNCKEVDWNWLDVNENIIFDKITADIEVAIDKAQKENKQAEIQKQQAYIKSNQNNNSVKSNTRKIGDVKVNGTTALIYDENGNYTNNVVQLGFKGSLSGFNSNYIVVTDGDYVKIHDINGNYINKGFNLCSGCFVKNVTSSTILVKDAYGTKYYDFNGDYTNKYVND
jgi:antitoxin component YwqK of YwqJK toxin-antitoxin module